MIHWIYLIPAFCIGWAVATLCTCCQSSPATTPNSEEDTMFKGVFKRIIKHLDNRRKWNRTKQLMRQHAYYDSRMTVGLMSSGALRLWK